MRHRLAPLPVPTGLCPVADVEVVSLALVGARAAALGASLGGCCDGGAGAFAAGPLAPRLSRLAALAALEGPAGDRRAPDAEGVPAFARSRLPARVTGVDGVGTPLPPSVARVVDAALDAPAPGAGSGRAAASAAVGFGAWVAPWMAPPAG